MSAAPIRGAATRAALAALARRLGVRAPEVRLERGATSRDKVVSVPLSAGEAVARALKETTRG